MRLYSGLRMRYFGEGYETWTWETECEEVVLNSLGWVRMAQPAVKRKGIVIPFLLSGTALNSYSPRVPDLMPALSHPTRV